MAISTGGGETPMSDINTTPLVDVMLVLLIIFLIAVPVAIQTIEKLNIPVFESIESDNKVENLQLTVSTTDASGRSAGEPGIPLADLCLSGSDPGGDRPDGGCSASPPHQTASQGGVHREMGRHCR